MFSVDGLISGLDTTAIVEGALSLQNSRLNRLNVRKQEITTEQTAFKTIEGRLLSLQGSLRNILRSTNNAFDKKTATSSDEDALLASASSKAAPGTYRLQVNGLAQAHQLASTGFASTSGEINSGTLKLQVGSRAEANVVIDSSNNTWQGLADAINSSGSDVRAAILDDGSGSATPFRLLLTSSHTGTANVISVTNNLDTGGGDQPDFSGPAVQDATDAEVQVGNGAGAITVKSPENQFDNMVPGTTLDVLAAEAGKEIVVTVANDTQQVVDALSGFVQAYNDVIDFIDTNSTYDPDTNTAGLLLGNRSAANVQSSLRRALSTVVDGVNENLRTLTSVGISTTSEGKLELDTTKLQEILDGEVDNVSIDDIRRLFAIDGQSDNPGVEFLLGTNRTKASPIDPETGLLIPYEVEINDVARQGNVLAGLALADNTLIDATNDVFKVEIDNVEIAVAIPHSTYTRLELAEQLETLINTSPDRLGRSSVIEIVGSNLSVASQTFGASSSVRILDGNANSTLGLTEDESSVGTNVAGVFRVLLPGEDPITEQAIGNGRTLTSKSENEYTAQLQIRSTLQENQIAAPTDAHLTVTRGIGAALDAAIGGLLENNPEEQMLGELTTTQDRLTRQIEAIDENIERVEAQIESKRESLLREFAALESTLAELQSVGSALSSNLATLTL